MRRQWCDIDFQQGEEANKELLKHLEKDFASQLVKTAVRYNLKFCGALRGKASVYLSAASGGDGLELAGHDDESGRQRWQLESGTGPSRRGLGVGFACGCRDLMWSGGTTPGRRLLSRGARCLELCEHDDGSGRQRWQVVAGSSGWVLRAAVGSGDPGLGAPYPCAAAQVEASPSLDPLCSHGKMQRRAEAEAAEAEWEAGRLCRGFQDPLAEASPRPKAPAAGEPEARERDELMEIVERSTSSVDWKAMSEDRMRRVLGQSRNLGTAIDLVGAYLKNYEIDKADRLCARIFPLCLERGGIWHFKLLNFYTTVRMKQSRYQEALEMYKEYETLIKFSPDEAWELYDTVYRNFGWIYTSLHDYDKALEYFERCVNVKKKHGVKAHWFDQWDLGKTHARLSLQQGRPERLEMAGQLIEEALAMHRPKPSDLIMRCKMLNSAGECFSVRGDFCSEQKVAERSWDRAIALHEESYELYMKVLGPSKPLTGWAMEDLAGAYKRRGRLEEAKRLILGALRVECSKDIIKLSSMARLLDAVLELHKETGDLAGLADCQDAINEGLENLQKRRIDRSEAASYAALLQKIAQLLLEYDVANREGAVALLQEGLGYLNHLEAEPAQTESRDTSQKPLPESAAPDGQERLHIPKAGQQEMQVDPEALKTSIQEQLQSLRTWPCRQSRGTSRPDCDQDIHFEVAGSSRI
ncbi:unnamed protein product [Symbiodinium necroappetens]|uniref:Uncharacterized protein n=1 Tax=Symbiodinium necroappetens TaxID=1628268 RepID=A0A812ZK27_9DINO|nr:unnamed protein product [Symbiodinium necroappetens]